MSIYLIDKKNAANKIQSLSDEFVLIENPEFIYPPFEIIPLTKKIYFPEKLIAAVMDMDGTTTTTEELCIESLELMIRKMSGLIIKEQWKGLDHHKDYPNIIGNSTTKHIEYLINTYRFLINDEISLKSFIEAIYWKIKEGKSEQRKNEVEDLLRSFELIETFNELIQTNESSHSISNDKEIINLFSSKINLKDQSNLIKIGIEIYYQHYHQYLLSLSNDKNLSSSKKLIEPLPGLAIFLALIKGLLGEEAEKVTETLINDFRRKNPETEFDFDSDKFHLTLKTLGIHFEKYPLKVAVVTSSIFYEADIVLAEVFKQMRMEIETWKISNTRKFKILDSFSSYKNYYDAIITASDAYEFRLKPHRDLYSIALYRLGISKENFDKVIGFEDSQSGTIAIRAAGIGCCIAVPFPQTKDHNLQAASYVLWNGLPEFILKHKCLIIRDSQ